MKKGILFALMMLLSIASTTYAQNPIELDILNIENPDQRVLFLRNLVMDDALNYSIDEESTTLFINTDERWSDSELQNRYNELIANTQEEFESYLGLEKEEQAQAYASWKDILPKELFALNFKAMLIENPGDRDGNQTCATSSPFCTTDVITFHVEANPGGSCETGPTYGCLQPYINRPPFWFHMKIGVAGAFTIRMTNSANVDIDYCCWGPFNDPVSPCPNQLTTVVDCGSTGAATEDCHIPASSQVGKYYIMVITKYNQSTATDITFSKLAGSGVGETDCGILPPLVSNDGPYCVGETIRLSGNAQAGATYTWSGPGGWTATGQNVTRPNCTMAMAGTYTCTIAVGNQTNSATTPVSIIAQPHANFTASAVCRGQATHFDASSSSSNPSGHNISNYAWNFGDNTPIGHGRTIDHTYSNAGTYNVQLTTSIESGENMCTDTKTQQVTVYPLPQPICSANPNPVPYGQTSTITANAGTGNISYHWEPANKVTNPNSATTTTIPLTENTTFTCTATNSQGGCSAEGTIRITINGSAMEAEATAEYTELCQGFSTVLTAIASGGTGNFTYSWSPASLVVNPTSASTATRELNESTTFTCTVTDASVGSTSVDVRINVLPKKEHDEHHYVCPGDDFEWSVNGETYSHPAEGYVDQHIFPVGNVCDSTVYLYIDYYPTYDYTIRDTICLGESYNENGWYGLMPDEPGLFPDVNKCLTVGSGCDSIVRLELYVRNSYDYPIEGSVCEGSSYPFNGQNLTEPGDYPFHGQTIQGCDSIVTLHLIQDNYLRKEYHKETCNEAYTWRSGNQILEVFQPIEGQLAHYEVIDTILVNPNSCDSMVSLYLDIYPTSEQTFVEETCDSYTWYWPGVINQTFTSSTQRTEIGQNFYGCDSIVHLDLTINNSFREVEDIQSGCDSIVWDVPGQDWHYVFTESGEKMHQFTTIHGCDSIVTMKATLEHTPYFDNVFGNAYVVGGSQLHYTLEAYQVWREDPNNHHIPSNTHYDTRWELRDKDGNPFDRWTITTSGASHQTALVTIYTFEIDSVELVATTFNANGNTSSCETITHSKWIHCGYADVQEYEDLQNVDIQPNPNNGTMSLTFENMRGDANVKVITVNGVMVDEFNVHNTVDTNIYPYSTHNLPDGLYFFVIANDNKVITKKVIVIK